MSQNESRQTEKLGAVPYIFAGMAFIPFLGFLFGVVAIFWGLVTRKSGGKRVAAIATFGLTATLIIYGSMYYINSSQRQETRDKLRVELSQGALNRLVPALEKYKQENQAYPESLEALKATLSKDSFVSIDDPRSGRHANEFKPFYYQRVDANHYYLRSLGADGRPFTSDDMVPQITPPTSENMGLLLEQRAQ